MGRAILPAPWHLYGFACHPYAPPAPPTVNSGDGIDYGQQKRQNMGDLVNETLEAFENEGGPDAFINIKYMVPTFESALLQ